MKQHSEGMCDHESIPAFSTFALASLRSMMCCVDPQVYWDFMYERKVNGAGWKHFFTIQACSFGLEKFGIWLYPLPSHSHAVITWAFEPATYWCLIMA